MPQSRHRKINKARKRPRVGSSTAGARPESAKARKLRLGAIILVLAVALSAVVWVITRPGTQADAGLRIEDLRVGDGPSPQPGQTITVHYVGTLENGEEFDNSYKKGGPVDFRIGVGAVIKGWDEGVMGMKVGGKRRLFVPSKLGYGPAPRPGIPANSNLLFEIELLGVK